MTSSLVDRQFQLLLKELELVDGAIRQLDDITKGIKNWAIVTWTAALGLTLATSALQPYVWITAVVPLLFWLVDASHRRVQRSFILRSRAISDYVNSSGFQKAAEEGAPLDFKLLRMREHSRHWTNRLLGVMVFRTISILYLGLILISLIAWGIASGVTPESPGLSMFFW